MGITRPLSAPQPLTEQHELDEFSCGESTLDEWLKRRARANQSSGASRTFVACHGNNVAAYYALSSGSVDMAKVPGSVRRNMPDPVPVVLLGRFAVDRAWQGAGIGRSLFRDLALRVCAAAETIGIRGILVHALTEDAQRFYLALGFDACPGERLLLVVTLANLRAALKL